MKEVILFGPYAKGTFTPTSNIDIVVKECVDLRALRDELDRIPTLKKIDAIDYDSCKNIYLKEDIDNYGKSIYATK